MRDRLESFADVREARDFSARLTALGSEKRKVLFDPQGSAEAVARLVEDAGGTIVESADPVQLPKAKKNAAELQGARAAHLRDGVAMARFLRFVETSAPGSLTEIDAAKALETFRAETAAEAGTPLADLAFDAISSTGPNGAINHYRVTERTNRRLEEGDLYLIDSGGQYRDGTTDITRTVPIGAPSRERLDLFRDRFTRVLRRATSQSRWRASRRARPARNSIPSRATRSGRRASTSTTAPATASALISPCTKGRSGSPRPATRRSSRA